MNNKRRKELKECLKDLKSAEQILHDVSKKLDYLQWEESIACDNMQEHFPSSSKADKLDETSEAMLELQNNFDNDVIPAYDDVQKSTINLMREIFNDCLEEFEACVKDTEAEIMDVISIK